MKKHLSKKLLWQSILSLALLGMMVMLSIGSEFGVPVETTYLGNGQYAATAIIFPEFQEEKTYGGRDEYQRWHGPVRIHRERITTTSIETVTMVHGVRHGVSKTKYPEFGMHGEDTYHTECYDMGTVIDCKKSAPQITTDISAYKELAYSYPWYLSKLIEFGHDSAFVEGYLDTLEMLIDSYEFEPVDFDNYYNEVMDSVEETRYDTIYQLHAILLFIQGYEEYKSFEFRMAVLDKYRSDGKSTFYIVNNTYPGSLQTIMEMGINEQDFERFCDELDSLMIADDNTYGSLDQENPFFIDSVDSRIFRAMTYISQADVSENTTSSKKSMRGIDLSYNRNPGKLFRELGSLFSQAVVDSAIQEAATAVFGLMLYQFDRGDIPKKALRKVWLSKQGVISIPTVTTSISADQSATSVTLKGTVIENGGADVTNRGVVWADFYNPTTNENTQALGSGLGSFEIVLDGLTSGGIYFARSYATNSAGTAYGNCIKFTVGGAVGVEKRKLVTTDLNIYPNPASGFAAFRFNVKSAENMTLTFVNMKGQTVYHHDLGILYSGENRIELDVSDLPNGLYSCQLSSNGQIRGTQKILISH